MNPVILYLQNQPTIDFHRKKLLLNEKFVKKAKIQGLVSYIYYPSQRECPLLGHAELEIEGDSWTLMGGESKVKSLSKMINSSQSGHGFPFFRFNISVTPDQLRELREKNMATWGTCSMGVLKTLSNHGNYEVPFPVTLFPFTSSMYLATAKMLGSRRINKIEFYREKNEMNSLAKSAAGVTLESFAVWALLYLSFDVVAYLAKGFYSINT
jgi:hypothetical protein